MGGSESYTSYDEERQGRNCTSPPRLLSALKVLLKYEPINAHALFLCVCVNDMLVPRIETVYAIEFPPCNYLLVVFASCNIPVNKPTVEILQLETHHNQYWVYGDTAKEVCENIRTSTRTSCGAVPVSNSQ